MILRSREFAHRILIASALLAWWSHPVRVSAERLGHLQQGRVSLTKRPNCRAVFGLMRSQFGSGTLPRGPSARTTPTVTLSWSPSTSTPGVAYYLVQRCEGEGCADFVTIGTTPATGFVDAGLLFGTIYSYRVQAVDSAGNASGFSNTATAITPTSEEEPTAPGVLIATTLSSSQINLSWTASTSIVGLANYIVERCQGVGCVNFLRIATTTAGNYSDANLRPGTTYNYRVQALNNAGQLSAYSNTVNAVTAYDLPLKASFNNRYLVDQAGTPFLILGDAPQALVGNLSSNDMAAYMANRAVLGFNALWVNLLCDSYTGCNSNGKTYDGVAPFTSGSDPSSYDLSTPNNEYFSRVDSMLSMASTYNLIVFLDPIETGGWLSTLENNGANKAFNYGVYIGNRYKTFGNIVWLQGKDFQSWSSSSTDNTLVQQVMAGIASVDTNHLQTIELNYNSSYSNQDPTLSTLLTLDSAYTYYETYDIVLQSYASLPTIPAYLVESNYEYENNTGALLTAAGPYVLREQAYWTLLSGGTGQIYGNHYIWSFCPGWQSYMNSPGALEIQYINQLFGRFSWWSLVPDAAHTIVTGGYGTYNGANSDLTTATYCTTSRITDGSLALSYCPKSTVLTVDLSGFPGRVTAQWYDPSSGAFSVIAGSPFQNSGTQNFATPSQNHDGDPDWVLVLQSTASNHFWPRN